MGRGCAAGCDGAARTLFKAGPHAVAALPLLLLAIQSLLSAPQVILSIWLVAYGNVQPAG